MNYFYAMEPKDFLLFILVVVLIYFRFGKGSRMLKKKSHHYIVPPAAKDDPDWLPIEMDEYDKFVFFKHDLPKNELTEYISFIESVDPDVHFKVNIFEDRVKFEVSKIDFSEFHYLIDSLFFDFGDEVIGFCKHKEIESQDYVIKKVVDVVDYLKGTFRCGQNFGIYLPKSDIDAKGNMSKSKIKAVDFDLEMNKIHEFGIN